MNALTQAIVRNAMGLGIFALVTAGLIAATQILTAERIDRQVREAEAGALREVVPDRIHDNDLLDDYFTLPASEELGRDEPYTGYRARRDGEVSAVVLPITAPNGYSGNIDLIVAIDRDGELLGVRVTSHQETPGLGDRIELRKDDWILDFEGRSLENPEPEHWHVVPDGGEFDAFSGATITPRAVVRAVYRSLVFFEEHREAVLDEAPLPWDEYNGDMH